MDVALRPLPSQYPRHLYADDADVSDSTYSDELKGGARVEGIPLNSYSEPEFLTVRSASGDAVCAISVKTCPSLGPWDSGVFKGQSLTTCSKRTMQERDVDAKVVVSVNSATTDLSITSDGKP